MNVMTSAIQISVIGAIIQVPKAPTVTLTAPGQKSARAEPAAGLPEHHAVQAVSAAPEYVPVFYTFTFVCHHVHVPTLIMMEQAVLHRILISKELLLLLKAMVQVH
jgi:hypothetical protein